MDDAIARRSGPLAVSKKKKRCCYENNSVKKLQMREICSKTRHRFNLFAEARFRNFHLQEECDTYNNDEDFPSSLLCLNRRSMIIRLFATADVIFVLTKSGVCAAFSQETKKRICFLNVSPNEVIRRLFHNQENDSLITISECESDNCSALICRTTSIKDIRRGEPGAGYRLFESESIKWPGFIEFDDVNGKVITHCAEDDTFKMFDMKSYTFLYSITDNKIHEITISPGILVLLYKITQTGDVPLKIVSIEDGTVLKSFDNILHKKKKVVFFALLTEKLLVKQENENLQIIDVRNFQITEVSKTEYLIPSAFFFLYGQLFLTCHDRTVKLWNLSGELVTSFEDNLLWRPLYNINSAYVTSDANFIISYCTSGSADGEVRSINISNILTGKCVGKITSSNSKKRMIQASKISTTVAKALKDITVIFYDEERNEIYTGNKLGQVHVWTN